jgi:uncharacterized protein (DUF885 family)
MTRRQLLGILGAGAVACQAVAREGPEGDSAGDANARFERRFSEPFFEQYWLRNTDQAVQSGYYRVADSLNVPDAPYRADYQRFLDSWLSQLRAVPLAQLNDRNRTDWSVLDSQLRYERWALTSLREWQWNPAVYNIAEPLGLILNTDYAPLDQRLRAAAARLAAAPAYSAAAIRALLRPTLEHTALAIQQNRGALQLLGGPLEHQLEGSGMSLAERSRIATQIKAARAAVQNYIDVLQRLAAGPASAAARSFRLGQGLYEQKFLFVHQSGESAPSLYRRALAEKQQVLARMDELSYQLWGQYFPDSAPPADRYDRIGRMIARLSENHVAAEDYVSAVERLIPTLADWVQSHRLIDLDPGQPLEVRETPLYERGVAIAGIEAPGPYDPGARTYFNVDPLDQDAPEQAESFLREYNNWMLPVFIAHEAIPGHYVQLMYANRSPSRIKSIFGNGAMIEGWAVYSERVMLESGYGGNAPEQWLIYWKWYLRSVTNTILDYSVHVLGMGESAAKELLRREAFQSASEVAGKWIRVQRSSVQLTQYYSGFSAIYRLRERMQRAQGASFDLKAFHEQFLSYGSAPVQVIAALMNDGASRP